MPFLPPNQQHQGTASAAMRPNNCAENTDHSQLARHDESSLIDKFAQHLADAVKNLFVVGPLAKITQLLNSAHKHKLNT